MQNKCIYNKNDQLFSRINLNKHIKYKQIKQFLKILKNKSILDIAAGRYFMINSM